MRNALPEGLRFPHPAIGIGPTEAQALDAADLLVRHRDGRRVRPDTAVVVTFDPEHHHVLGLPRGDRPVVLVVANTAPEA